MENGFNVNSRDEEDETTLMHFLCKGQMADHQVHIVRDILVEGTGGELQFDVGVRDKHGMKAVHYLRRQNKIDTKNKMKLIKLFEFTAAGRVVDSNLI